MKNVIYIKLILVLLVFGGCEKYLEAPEDQGLSESYVFRDYRGALGYLDAAYKALENNYGNARGGDWGATAGHRAAWSDEAAHNWGAANNTNQLNEGDWFDKEKHPEFGWVSNDDHIGRERGKMWVNSFFSLRVANRIIGKVDEIPDLTAEERSNLLGQAHFYRAWNYFQVIRRWGGMPIYDRAYATDDDVDLPRLSYSESTNWIIENLDEAIKHLPATWDITQTGRPIKASAYALKSMAALYASSPLMNNPQGIIKDNGYNREWAVDAAAYANDAINYIKTVGKDMAGLGLTDSAQIDATYKAIFYQDGIFEGAEDLWYHHEGARSRFLTNGASVKDVICFFQTNRTNSRNGSFGQACTSVSQNLIDMFEVINVNGDGEAYPFGHPALNPGFDPNTNWTDLSKEQMYANRDPRFYINIIYNGGKPHGTIGGQPHYFGTYPNGPYDPSSTADEANDVITGYMCKKWWAPSMTRDLGTGVNSSIRYNGVWIRATQVYLDYAEAMNEAYGPNNDNGYGLTAVEAINLIRERVGMVPVNSIYTGSKEAFRERIRNERAVELMWEHHRWFDIRRWMLFEDLFDENSPIKGVTVIDNTPTESDIELKDLRFSKVDIATEPRLYMKKHYWYPLPKKDVEMMYNFTQNPGW